MIHMDCYDILQCFLFQALVTLCFHGMKINSISLCFNIPFVFLKRKSYSTMWGWANDDWKFIYGWTSPLTLTKLKNDIKILVGNFIRNCNIIYLSVYLSDMSEFIMKTLCCVFYQFLVGVFFCLFVCSYEDWYVVLACIRYNLLCLQQVYKENK